MNSNPYSLAFKDGWIFTSGPLRTLGYLSRLPNAQWINGTELLAFPANRAAFLAAEMCDVPVAVSQEYKQARADVMKADPDIIEDIRKALRKLGFVRELLPYQLECLYVSQGRRGFYNAMTMGLGKTTWALAAAALGSIQRVLVVCPKSVCRTWQKEWEVCFSHPRSFGFCLLDEGSTADRRHKLINIGCKSQAWPVICTINYEVLDSLQDAIYTYSPNLVIMDESHRVKSEKTAVTKAAIKIADKADRVILLSGTPMGNGLVGDLWSQLRILGQHVMPESYWDFVSRYAKTEQIQVGSRAVNKIIGLQDPAELAQRLEPVWYRCTKELVLDLPPKQYEIVEFELPTDVANLYKSLERDGEAVLGKPLSLATSRVVDIRLQQICGGFKADFSYDEEEDDIRNINGSIPSFVVLDSPKINWIQSFTKDTLEDNPNSRCIIWVKFNMEGERIYELLQEILGKGRVVFVKGDTRNKDIEEICNSFNSRDPEGIQVIVAQIKKLCVGVNLPACDNMIYYSNSWSYLERTQSEDRGHRIGSTGGLTIYDLLIRKSIDIEVKDALSRHENFNSRVCVSTLGEMVEA